MHVVEVLWPGIANRLTIGLQAHGGLVLASLYFAKFAFSEIVCYAFYRTYTSLLLAF